MLVVEGRKSTFSDSRNHKLQVWQNSNVFQRIEYLLSSSNGTKKEFQQFLKHQLFFNYKPTWSQLSKQLLAML
jgi:hypothetical protein